MNHDSTATTKSRSAEAAIAGSMTSVDAASGPGGEFQAIDVRRLPPRLALALVALHFVAGVVLSLLASGEPTIATMIFVGIVLCQSSLVGLWGALSRSHPLVRLIGAAAALAIVGTELTWAVGEDGVVVVALVLFATLPVTAVMWIIRCLWATLLQTDDPKQVTQEGLQFSIRSLMLFTFAISCLLTLGRVASPYLAGIETVTRLIVIGICSVSIALTSIWTALGLSSPFLRCGLVFAIAGTAGWLAGSSIPTHFTFWIEVMLLHTLFLLGSLCIVRRCGYRLVAKRPRPAVVEAVVP